MKRHTFALILAAVTTLLNGCQTKKEKAFQSSEGVSEVVNRLNDAFGKSAHYTDITMSYVKGVGSTISATGTSDPTSTKLISKLHSGGDWEDVSEVTLELSGGAKPADFLFTLDEVDQLKKVPEMVKVAIEKVKKEKNVDVVAEHVSVKYPSRISGPDDTLGFDVNLRPENGALPLLPFSMARVTTSEWFIKNRLCLAGVVIHKRTIDPFPFFFLKKKLVMTLQLNQVVPTVHTLHELVAKTALPTKYKCELIQDRFTLSFSQPRQCILIKKSEIIGVGLFVNEKTNSIDIDGIVPNKILNQVVFRNYVTRLLLIRSWNQMESEVAGILTNQFQ